MAKITLNTTSVAVPANELLGTKEKNLYYLVIGDGNDKLTINVGEKTHNAVMELVKKAEGITKIQFETPLNK